MKRKDAKKEDITQEGVKQKSAKKENRNKEKVKNNPKKALLKLMLDVIFRNFFTKNKDTLYWMLESFLPLPEGVAIKNIQILDGRTNNHPEDKESLLDLKILLNNQERINVEMQANSHSGFTPRTLYYWSSLYGEGFKKGESYNQLARTYSLIFTDFNWLCETKDFITSFSILSQKPPHFPLSDHLNITVVELPKFEKGIKKLEETKDYLCYLLKYSHKLTEEDCKQLSNYSKEMKQAMEQLKELSQDESMRILEEAREKQRRDKVAFEEDAKERGYKKGQEEGHKEGHKKGQEEGQEKGRKENLREVVLRMKAELCDVALIQKVTGLSQPEIEKM